jgi:hypothetical protein
MPTATAPDIRQLAAGKLRWSLAHFIKSFNATPDDKLDFKPSPTANSPRELILHVLGGNGHVAHTLGMEMDPTAGPTDRDALLQRLTETTEIIASKLETVPDEQLDTMVDFVAGKMPMPVFLFIEDWHVARHAGQLDYLQTIWGDMENYF